MLEAMKRKTLPGKLALGILLLIPAVLFAAVFWSSARLLVQGPADLYALGADDLEGTYAGAEITTIYDYYADTIKEDENGEELVAREYLVPVGDGSVFIGVQVDADKIDAGDAVMQETWAWQADPDNYTWSGVTLNVQGSIRPMDYETTNLYYSMLEEYYGLSGEDLDIFLPLVLVDGDIDGIDAGGLLALGILFAVFLVGALVPILRSLTGSYQSGIRRYCAAEPDPESAYRALDTLYADTQPQYRVRCNDSWMIYEQGALSWVLRTDDIAWIYPSTRTVRVYFIPVRHYSVTVCGIREDKRRRRHQINLKNQQQQQEVIDLLHRLVPDAMFGYDARLEKPYNADPAAFAASVRASRGAAAAAAAAQAAPAAPAAPVEPAAQPDLSAAAAAAAPVAPAADTASEPAATRTQDPVGDTSLPGQW